MATMTFTAPASDSELGRIEESTWSGARDSSSSQFVWTPYETVTIESSYDSDSGYTNKRVFINFDTSALPDNISITSATLKIYGKNVTNAPVIYVVSHSANTPYSTSDYSSVDFTTPGSSGYSSSTGEMSISLNSDGIGFINPTGETKIAIITEHDLNNTAPTDLHILGIASGDSATNKPEL